MRDVDRSDGDTEGGGDVLDSRGGKWVTVPPECLALIFEAGLECVFPDGDFNEETTDDSELCQYISNVTQTCRWWRQVALDSPRLWRILILNESTSLWKLETWLERSKAAPLYINLQEGPETSAHIATRLVPLLLKHIHHWGKFLFVSDTSWGLASFLEAIEGKQAPLLKELVLSQAETGDMPIQDPSPIPALKLFHGPDSVPKLARVDLWCIPLDWNSSPFRNLRALSLANMQDGDKLRIAQFMAALHESPQLIQLALVQGVVRPDELATAFSRSSQTPQPISLPSLTILLISDFPDPDVLNLTLRLIYAPNLEQLRLFNLNSTTEGFDIDFSSTFETLGNGVASSFERLTSLQLRRVSCRSNAAWHLFCKRLTEVRHLGLGYLTDGPVDPRDPGDAYSGYLSSLLRSIDRPDPELVTHFLPKVACPNLQSIYVAGCSEHTITNFARRRLKAGYGLTQVIYGGHGEPPDSMIYELDAMDVECGWCTDTDSEVGSDSETEGDDNPNL